MKKIPLRGWFDEPGAYVLVDGQYGSTGKGLLAGWLAEGAGGRITHVTTNAGPNSGHTAYFQYQANTGDYTGEPERVMTQQIPVASVFLHKMGYRPITLLNGGAVIDSAILLDEFTKYDFDTGEIFVHPNAVVIEEEDRRIDKITTRQIAGTGKGIGPAQARKVLRHGGNMAMETYRPILPPDHHSWDDFWDWKFDVVFVETAQGYSLGINSSRFYPNVTSRECTVMQAIADARIPAQMVKKVVACYRTFPIRVGNTEGSSGDCYEDQYEMHWEDIGQPPELTTVTKRVRRLFSWSRIQFRESVAVNRPDVIFINFMNYLKPDQQAVLLQLIEEDYLREMDYLPTIICGNGPLSSDIGVLADHG
jgi:adenylosuccinate synthase